MKQIAKFGLFLFVIAAMLIGGNLPVLGPVTLRHFCSVLLLCIYGCALLSRSLNRMTIYCLKLYLIYLLVYAGCNVMNGEFTTVTFLRSFYTYHIPSLALIVGLMTLIRTEKDLRLMVGAICTLFIANCLVSILQFFDFQPAWRLALMISSAAEEGIESAEMYNNAYGNVFGYSLVMGLFGFVVTNGYFLASFLPVATFRIHQKGRRLFFGLTVFLLAAYCIYFVQQRMAFVLLVAYAVYIIVVRVKSKGFLLFAAIVAVLMAVLFNIGWQGIDMGRLTSSVNNDTRVVIYEEFWDYVTTPGSLFGGQEAYFAKYQKYQHNTLTASYVAGGLLTFLVFSVLFFRLLFYCLKILWRVGRNKTRRYTYSVGFALASVFFLLYSFTHSAGVHSGSPMFWLSYVLLFYSLRFESEDQ